MSSSKKSEDKSKKNVKEDQDFIVSRKAWGAVPAKSKLPPLETPVKEVVYTETDTKSCSTKQECIEILKGIQKFHIDVKGLHDIEHNFMIGGDGNVYEGRGWHSESSSLEKEHGGDEGNSQDKALEVAFIGNFKEGDVPKQMKEAAQRLILYGVENKLIYYNEKENDEGNESEGGEPDRRPTPAS